LKYRIYARARAHTTRTHMYVCMYVCIKLIFFVPNFQLFLVVIESLFD